MKFEKIFEEEEEEDLITIEEVLEILDDIEADEETDANELALVHAIQYFLENSPVEIPQHVLSYILDMLEEFYEVEDEGEIDYDSIEAADEYNDVETGDQFGSDYSLSEAAVKKMVRGGKIVKRKAGFRKVGGSYKKIKASTIRKLKRSARKRKHKKIKSATKMKMKRSKKKTMRRFKSFLKRNKK